VTLKRPMNSMAETPNAAPLSLRNSPPDSDALTVLRDSIAASVSISAVIISM